MLWSLWSLVHHHHILTCDHASKQVPHTCDDRLIAVCHSLCPKYTFAASVFFKAVHLEVVHIHKQDTAALGDDNPSTQLSYTFENFSQFFQEDFLQLSFPSQSCLRLTVQVAFKKKHQVVIFVTFWWSSSSGSIIWTSGRSVTGRSSSLGASPDLTWYAETAL